MYDPPWMAPSDARALPPRATALLLALVAALLLFRLGAVPLLGPDEPRYTRVAIEMHRSGDWVTPRLQGEPWLEKPALYYWLAAGGFSVLGETEAAARLPSVLATLVAVGTTALAGARLYGTAAGLHAGFVLGLSLLPFGYGRAAAMDMLLAASVTAALAFLALGLLDIAGRAAIPAAYVCMALATLAKGLLGVALPALVVAGYVVATRQWSLVRRVLSPAGLLLFVLVAGPWYLLVGLDQGRHFIEVFFLNHHVARFASTVHNHPGPWYYYVPVLLGGLFPWTGFALPGLVGLRPQRSRSDLFVLLWLALPLAFFSAAASKLPGYVLPCLPPLALVTGRAVDDLVRGQTSGLGWGRVVALVGLVLSAGLTAAVMVLAQRGEPRAVTLAPAALWTLVIAFAFSRRVAPDPVGATRLLRTGAAGVLVLLALALPPLLAERESGKHLFAPAAGREVLVWNAWRTAWMAGYVYNDGRVREVAGPAEIVAAAEAGPVLVLCAPHERRELERAAGLKVTERALGPRRNALLEVERAR